MLECRIVKLARLAEGRSAIWVVAVHARLDWLCIDEGIIVLDKLDLIALEAHRDIGSFTVSMLGDNDLCLLLVSWLFADSDVVRTMDEDYHIGILLD